MAAPTRPIHNTLAVLTLLAALPANGAEWSNTELQLQYGNLDIPTFAGGGDSYHLIYTLQHASGWKYGDNFFFVDVLDARDPGFQDSDIYSEWYANFSLGKMREREVRAGIVSDVGLTLGVNWGADANVRKFVPGLRLSLDLPGFAFANLNIAAYIDHNEGAASGGAPREDDALLVDFSFARPFNIGEANFSIEGHAEYLAERENEFGGTVESWILAQPQLRWNPNDRISLGIEYQFWMNKLGDPATDESALQALFVWKF